MTCDKCHAEVDTYKSLTTHSVDYDHNGLRRIKHGSFRYRLCEICFARLVMWVAQCS